MSTDRLTLRTTVVALLCAIAPEVEPETLMSAKPLRQQVDLDSMDWLNFLISLHERLGVSIPEGDYAGLITLDDVLDYLQKKMA